MKGKACFFDRVFPDVTLKTSRPHRFAVFVRKKCSWGLRGRSERAHGNSEGLSDPRGAAKRVFEDPFFFDSCSAFAVSKFFIFFRIEFLG